MNPPITKIGSCAMRLAYLKKPAGGGALSIRDKDDGDIIDKDSVNPIYNFVVLLQTRNQSDLV